jgi:cytochrome b561
MPVSHGVARYGGVAMTLHWLIAFAVILNILLGLAMSEILSDGDAARGAILQMHKSVGLTVLTLSVLRLGWRLINPAPPLPASISPRLRALARATHFLLYFLIIAIPLTGWLLVSTSRSGAPTYYFHLFHVPNPAFLADLPAAARRPLHRDFHAAHVILGYSAIALIALHVAGAFYHLQGGHALLSRMLPGARVSART